MGRQDKGRQALACVGGKRKEEGHFMPEHLKKRRRTWDRVHVILAPINDSQKREQKIQIWKRANKGIF